VVQYHPHLKLLLQVGCHPFSGIDRPVLSAGAAKLNREVRKFPIEVSAYALVDQLKRGTQKILYFRIDFEVLDYFLVFSCKVLEFR